MTIINPATFVVETSETASYGVRDEGTVEATVNGKTRRVRAVRWPAMGSRPASITAYGIAVRYRTGTKIWSGHATRYDNGRESVDGGLDNHARAKFAYVVGFMDDFADERRSKR